MNEAILTRADGPMVTCNCHISLCAFKIYHLSDFFASKSFLLKTVKGKVHVYDTRAKLERHLFQINK